MAATLMQPPTQRRSMDHVASFDRSRPSSTVAPFASAGYDRAPSPAAPPGIAPRSRTTSLTSVPTMPSITTSPFQPQFAVPNFYAPFPMHQQGWAPPGQAFYSASAFHGHAAFASGGGAPPAGFSPPAFPNAAGATADFSAWAHVYQQMVAGGHMPAPGIMPSHQGGDVDDVESVIESPRRRTSSAPRPSPSASGSKGAQVPPTFHPYQRTTKSRNTSRDMTDRSVSQPSTPISLDGLAKPAPQPRNPSPAGGHQRSASSIGSSQNADFVPPPKLRDAERPPSVHSRSSTRSRESGGGAPPIRTASPAAASSGSSAAGSAAPSVKPGNGRAQPSAPSDSAAATANANSNSRPSPLSQTAPLIHSQPVAETERKGPEGTIRIRSNKPVNKASISAPSAPVHAASGSPRPPSGVMGSPGNAPFINVQAMTSDVSLADTERTTPTTASIAGVKPKRGLFRNRNKSSDNISLSSTVSSASMMIRKMGSIGKLARRNSLMGISRIFKDKPKDEDAGLPEKVEKSGSILGFKKKGKKAEAAPATVSRSVAEVDRGDDVLGLSPAAQLARQHTARSKAEASKRAEEARKRNGAKRGVSPEMGGASGEPTWDRNTTTRIGQTSAASAAAAAAAAANGTSIVHVVPRGPTVVQAVGYSAADVESISSNEGNDTVDDLTASMQEASLQDDEDFQPLWTQAHVDYNARPKKGILKYTVSNENIETQARQRSASTSDAPQAIGGPLSSMPAPLPEKIDGAIHAPHTNSVEFLEGISSAGNLDPLSPDFSPFDSPTIELDLKPSTIYQRPAHNTSAPALSVAGQPLPQRSMTAPARRRLVWAPECAVYSTYDGYTYDRRSEPATCNRLTPDLAMAIKQELNEFKLEMPVHPSSRVYTHYFA